MKSILMSIKPKWVEKIASGEKTVEVRKTVPKCGTPFKVYMYCTNDRKETLNMANGQGFWEKGELYLNGNCYYPYTDGTLNGKVVGEFVCNKLICCQAYYDRFGKKHLTNVFDEDIKMSCLSEYELYDYITRGKALNANILFDGWLIYISDLKIYDKPKELSEFQTPPCDKSERACEKCKYLVKINTPDRYEVDCFVAWGRPIARPPQSWQFVKEMEV